jgi:nucleotide-binding universal stress UspA family protein
MSGQRARSWWAGTARRARRRPCARSRRWPPAGPRRWSCSRSSALPRTEDSAEGAADFDERRRFAEKTFASAREGLPGALRERVSLRFAESGDAAGTVCEYARQHGFDLLALGRHGTGGVLHPRLGHVAATAARKAALPVLLAP